MTQIYRVESKKRLHFSDPLHVGRFYPDIERHHPKTMQDRQDLILYLANLHANAVSSGKPLGFCEIPIRLMTLREWVHDYHVAFDHFFDVRRLGFNLGEKFEISTVTPKLLKQTEVIAASRAAKDLSYVLPPLPDDGEVSKVYIQQQNKDRILDKLAEKGRLDLHAPVRWLLEQTEVNFYFVPAGKLKLRDTSVWPIPSIETWPSWLREDLFGQGLDIDSAYTQFLVQNLNEAYAERPQLIQLLYPDLVRSLEDKVNWRKELCSDILGLEFNDENISVVKKICMALANGSTISPAILNGVSSYSITRDIVIEKVHDISITNLDRIGKRLQSISKQYKNARKAVCSHHIKLNPSRANQKKVFESYFEWERQARYQIWEAVDRHGIMVHDGIDGIPEEYLQNMPSLIQELNIKLTRS